MFNAARLLTLLFLASLLLVASGGPFSSTVEAGVSNTIMVDGTTCTLADAIRSANTDTAVGGCTTGVSGQDRLLLQTDVMLSAADTTYSAPLANTYAGLPDISTFIIIDGEAGRTIERDPGLTCAPADPDQFRLFNVTGTGRLDLWSITLQNGCAAPSAQSAYGGAIYVVANGVLVVDNSTIQDNVTQGPAALQTSNFGGAVFGEVNTTISVVNSTFRRNAVAGGSGTTSPGGNGYGGAVGSQGAVTASDSTFAENVARGGNSVNQFAGTGGGGAIMSVGAGSSIALQHVQFLDNLARGGQSQDSFGGTGIGGAVFKSQGSIGSIAGTVFDGNVAEGGDSSSTAVINGASGQGGALYTSNASISSIFNTRFSGNSAISGGGSNAVRGGVAEGGAFYLGSNSSLASVDSVTFLANLAFSRPTSDNTGGSGRAIGGGMVNFGTISTFTNSTFSGNRAEGSSNTGSGAGYYAEGGGLWNVEVITTFAFNTLANNRAVGGTGAGGDGYAAGGGLANYDTITLSNNILADNIVQPGGGAATPEDCWYALQAVVSGGYNVVGEPSFCSFGATGDQTGVDAGLAPIADNACTVSLADGSCLETHALLANSPAIDAGSCTALGLLFDARGDNREYDVTGVADVDDGCDSGAFELQQQVPANPPTVLEVQTTCQSVTVDYLARDSGDTAAMVVRLYREVPGGTDDLVVQESAASTETAERYSQTLAFGRVYPAGTMFYLVFPTSGGTLTTPAQPCSGP